MKKFLALFLAAFLLGCVSIEKPSWNPGTTVPAPQVAKRETCPLPAQWIWNSTHKQWVCTPVQAYYYGPMYPMYAPPVFVAPRIYYPVFSPY